MDGEDHIIQRIARGVPSVVGRHAGLFRLGIGDDAAVIAPSGRTEWVLSCDAFLEGIHFLGKADPPDSIGYKSLVRAASDLAAMGGSPRLFFLTLALPASRTGVWLDELVRGMGRAARFIGMRLAGGDTTRSKIVAISITVLGEIAPGKALTRSGARPGDIIYVSGTLGRAQLGLDLARRGLGGQRRYSRLMQSHFYPGIRVELGAWLARRGCASAMMDISDGLSSDLARLCAASQVGARLWAARIPRVAIPAGLAERIEELKLDPRQMALHGGDDYELLFTVPPDRQKLLRKAPGFSELTAVGEVTANRQILIVSLDGRAKPLMAGGWDPFRKR